MKKYFTYLMIGSLFFSISCGEKVKEKSKKESVKKITMLDRELFAAAAFGQNERIVKLLKKGANVNAVFPSTGETPLHHAASQGKLDAVKILLSHGANINTKSYGLTPGTPLDDAIHQNQYQVIKYLLKNGAKTDIEGFGGFPLTVAIQQKKLNVVKLLVEHGADVNKVPKQKGLHSPLDEAIYVNNLEMVKYLVDRGAKILRKDADGYTALSTAEYKGYDNIVKFLKQYIKDSKSGTKAKP